MFKLTKVLLDAAIDAKGLAGLGAGLAIGLGALGTTLGIGNAAGRALEGASRQPEMYSKLQTLLLISIVVMESFDTCQIRFASLSISMVI